MPSLSTLHSHVFCIPVAHMCQHYPLKPFGIRTCYAHAATRRDDVRLGSFGFAFTYSVAWHAGMCAFILGTLYCGQSFGQQGPPSMLNRRMLYMLNPPPWLTVCSVSFLLSLLRVRLGSSLSTFWRFIAVILCSAAGSAQQLWVGGYILPFTVSRAPLAALPPCPRACWRQAASMRACSHSWNTVRRGVWRAHSGAGAKAV